ncbi:hypothetical protein SERLA73DRAFT_77949 [Serpula lacrymans var. lacrymans S7.3]|uniref:Uncharacterized protein n=2 Tax=Serpula lacrymans var. lacrymans TaxID=341189 RepID=F8QBK1_SERL3|nr:uncharacterized protein SERLADRAFT_442856 [Serpula lacrymans var. lacrymans S7.9]EGN94587.1 hypothetical protein SERLA73DRAFT_77949 [Serpula lacrymans var. lacrymans S7.3]EGO20063.1 hypothetical protein SERLADRAFT_442856 [Serpula lacrymans var. lacrymans S7.9]
MSKEDFEDILLWKEEDKHAKAQMHNKDVQSPSISSSDDDDVGGPMDRVIFLAATRGGKQARKSRTKKRPAPPTSNSLPMHSKAPIAEKLSNRYDTKTCTDLTSSLFRSKPRPLKTPELCPLAPSTSSSSSQVLPSRIL